MQALPPEPARALFEWAFRQARPFTAAEAIAGAGIAGAGAAAQVPVALAVHPSVAAWGGRYFTPRILAARVEFVVRLLPAERGIGVLADGHRLVPFRRFESRPGGAILLGPGGERLVPTTVTIPRDDAEACYTLLGTGAIPWKGEGPLAAVPGWKLPPRLWTRRHPPLEYRVKCADFDRAEYEIRPHESYDEAEDDHDALMDALGDVLDEPPPGPRFTARQLLQALARCYDRLGANPVGPLGPLTAGYFEIADVNGRAVFVLDADDVDGSDVPVPPPGPEPAPPDPNDPAAKLLAALDEAVEASRFRRRGMDVISLEWLGDRSWIVARVRASQWNIYDFTLSLETPYVPLHGACRCAMPGQVCEHAAAAFEVLARELRQGTSEFSRRVRGWLALAPWQVALRRIDGVLAKESPQAAPAAPVERVTWRFSVGDGGLGLVPCVQKKSAKGAWSGGKTARAEDLLRNKRHLMSEQDVVVARALHSRATSYGWMSRYDRQLSKEELVEVTLRLVGHPLVYLEGQRDPIPVERAPLRLEVEAIAAGGFRLGVSAGEVEFRDCPLIAEGTQGFVVHDAADGRILVVECAPRARELAAEIRRADAVIPKEAAAELESRLGAIESVAPLDLPQELAGEPVPADPRPVLRLAPRDPSGLDAALRVRPLPGAPAVFPPGDGPARAGASVDGRRRSALRDTPAELERASAQADALGLRGWTETAPWTWTTESDEEALALVERAQSAAPDALAVEWPDPKRRLKVVSVAEPDLRVRIEQKNDWFGLDGHIEVDGGRVALASLLAALRDNRRFVQVSPGHWIALAREFRDRLRQLADLSLPGKSGLEVNPVAAPFVAELVKEAGLVKACEAWTRLAKRLNDAAALSPEPPRAFRAELRDYQRDGYRWMARLAAWGAGGCLADDMGLGKTVQALALLMDRAAEGPALVVAPTSVTSNWLAETARFAPTLRPLLYRETDRRRAVYGPGDLVLASYGLVLRDAARLEQVPWGTLVLDEAQAVKNSRTQTASAIRRIPAKWRLALTGTPVENHLGDLWSLFRAVSPGLFGSWDSFRDRFAAPIERGRDTGRREALARLVRPFVLRRTKGEVLRELPARTEIVLRAELSPEERALYDAARLAAAMSLADGARKRGAEERIQVLAALTRLRQFACHPRLVVPEAPPSSAKLRLLLRTVEELREGKHRALVFSQFTSFLALVRAALDEARVPYRYLDGSTPPRRRDEEIAAFQRGEGDLFLISLKAGGTGLNLTAADYVLHLDPWWNPAVEDQATDRAHRIGQTRPVTVYRLVAADTIEEKILQLHGSKRELIAGVLEGTDQAARLSTDELIALIREGSAGNAADARAEAVRS